MMPFSLPLDSGAGGRGTKKGRFAFANEAVYAGQIFRNLSNNNLQPIRSYETKKINKQIKELKEFKKQINKSKITKGNKQQSKMFDKIVGFKRK